MTRFLLILVSLLFVVGASTFVAPPPSSSIHGIHSTRDLLINFSRAVTRKSKTDESMSNEDTTNEKNDAIRKGILGLLFPLAVAISANAPFLYVIVNPPSPEERETMLMDFCKGDVCTLLGGGSGFGGGDQGGDLIGAEVAAAMPSLQDFEAMARTAAEMATGVDVGSILN